MPSILHIKNTCLVPTCTLVLVFNHWDWFCGLADYLILQTKESKHVIKTCYIVTKVFSIVLYGLF